MAGGQERILRRRIKTVESTKKITRAMELIAATRVVKAQERANAARPYSEEITSVVLDLVRQGAGKDDPLLRANPQATTAAVIAITSDRGLCGAYNNTIIRMAERAIKGHQEAGRDYALIVVGKKALSYFNFRGLPVAASFTGVTDQPSYEQAREIGSQVIERYASGDLVSVELAYTRFISVGTQQAVLQQFLPLTLDSERAQAPAEGPSADFEYEPSPAGILSEILPRFVEARIYAALLDASASEYASRQRAMKAATDNAGELITKLSRIMNRARQDAITTEIMEIVGGAEALGADKGSAEDLMLDHPFPLHLFPQDPDPRDHHRAYH
jgi:F-type H+-transporting ATPase subunit gamma